MSAASYLPSRKQVNGPIEACCLFALIMLYIWWLRGLAKPLLLLPAALLVISHYRRGETSRSLGFHFDPFCAAAKMLLPAAAVGTALLLAIRLSTGGRQGVTLVGMGGVLLLYPVWGLFQQYLLNGYFANRLWNGSAHRTALASGGMFAVAHAPNWFLMIGTLLWGYAAVRAYLATRNLPALGLLHGWFGFLTYLCAPDRLTHHLYVGPGWFTH